MGYKFVTPRFFLFVFCLVCSIYKKINIDKYYYYYMPKKTIVNENVLEIEFWRVKRRKKNRKVKMWS